MNKRPSPLSRFSAVLFALLAASPAFADFQQSAEERRMFADGLMSRHLFARAATEYAALLRDVPNAPGKDEILFRWGESLREDKRLDEADGVFARLAAECPESGLRPKAFFKRGALALDAKRFADAAGFFRQSLDAKASGEVREDSLYFLAESLAKANRQADAIPHFETFLGEFPQSAYVAYTKLSLASALERRAGNAANADSARAHALLREAADSTDAKVAADALYLLGQCHYVRSDFAKSTEVFGELRRRFPTSPRAEEAAMRMAWAGNRSGRPEESLAIAEETLARATVPQRDEWLYLKGTSLFQLKRYAEAAEAMMTVVNDHSSSPYLMQAAFTAAVSYENVKRHEDALKILALIPKTDPLRPRVLRHSGLCAEALSRNAQALEFYRELDANFPADEDAENTLFRLAYLSRTEKRWAEASGFYRDFAKRFPKSGDSPAALFAAGVCAKEAGTVDAAMDAWRALANAHPQDPLSAEAAYRMGIEDYLAKRYPEALAQLEACIAHGGATPERRAEAKFWRATLLLQLQRHEEALAALREVEAGSPPPDRAKEIRFQLWTVLQKLDRRDEAADMLTALLRESPVDERLLPKQVAWAVEHQYHRGRLDEALAVARFLAKGNVENEWKQEAWAWVGRIEAKRGDPAAAEAAYRAATDIAATTRYTAEAFLRVGEYRYAAKDYAAAEGRFLKAMDLAQGKDLENIRVHASIGLARSWREQGRKEEAARQLLGLCMFYRDDTLIPALIQETVPLLRELGQNAEADALLQDLEEMKKD